MDGRALLEVVWASLVAGIGVTAAFALAILGTSRFGDTRRDGRPVEAAAFALMTVAALAACAAAVVLGIVAMTTK